MAGPRRREFPRPTAWPRSRRYLSDKQRTPPSRGAEHVAKCGPELLTPQMGQGDPAYVSRNTGRAGWQWRAGAFNAPDISVRLQDCKNGSGAFLRTIDHLQTQIVVLEAAPTWATSWTQEDNHQYVCSGKCV